MELSYVRWLDKNSIRWKYEPRLFQLSENKYLPDFYLIDLNEWHEVKGRWMGKSKIKFEEVQELYPNETFKLIDIKKIKEIRKQLEE